MYYVIARRKIQGTEQYEYRVRLSRWHFIARRIGMHYLHDCEGHFDILKGNDDRAVCIESFDTKEG